MKAEPQQEHERLKKMLGNWNCEGQGVEKPGEPVVKWKSTESVRSLGGLWAVAEGTGEMLGGGTAHTIMTLGFDPQKGRYVGTFIGSMMPNLWVYDGVLEESGLTLHTEGPAMSGNGQTAKYKDIIEFKSNDHRMMTSVMQGEDGQWHEVMTTNYYRSGQ